MRSRRHRQTLAAGSQKSGPCERTRRGVLAAVAILATLPLWQAPARAAPVLSSTRDGVTVKVAPKQVGADRSTWTFGVTMDTHTQELADDPASGATLVTDDGRRLKPSAWKGAGPGGHHREGVLVFDVPTPRPAAYTLEIARPGESAPRVFRWP